MLDQIVEEKMRVERGRKLKSQACDKISSIMRTIDGGKKRAEEGFHTNSIGDRMWERS